MEEAQGVESQEDIDLPNEEIDESEVVEESEGNGSPEKDPLYVQKRLKRKDREHQREMRRMQEQMNALQQQIMNQVPQGEENNYPDDNASMSPDQQIEKAVKMALQSKEEEAKKSKVLEHQRFMHKQYQNLQAQLDSAADKYDDFDDVVMDEDAPFTDAMRESALLLPNASEVFYKLGKDKEKLKRISELHPLEQGREVVKLAMALMNGGGNKPSVPDSMSQIKTAPVSKNNSNLSVSEIRKLMKAGKFK